MRSTGTRWPKTPPKLTAKQEWAREQYMLLWHKELPIRYKAIERFNHGFSTSLPIKNGSVTLEIGAGLGEHSKYENLADQDYYCLEYRPEMCSELKKVFPADRIICGDIQKRQQFKDSTFDRVIAIHVLEHLTHLPQAIQEIQRLLKDDGVFDVVIPCEGGLAHRMGRKLTAERHFRSKFHMDFEPIMKNEHVSTFVEIMEVLNRNFVITTRSFFPLQAPVYWMNFVAGFRLTKRL